MTARNHPRRPLGKLVHRLARTPIVLHRLGLGRLLGQRFALVEHVGRKTGLPRWAVLEVLRHDDDTVDVAGAWGPRPDWFHNVAANPRGRLDLGRRRHLPARAEILDREAATEALRAYATAHPIAARALTEAFGLPIDDPDRLAAEIPVVRFHLDRPLDAVDRPARRVGTLERP